MLLDYPLAACRAGLEPNAQRAPKTKVLLLQKDENKLKNDAWKLDFIREEGLKYCKTNLGKLPKIWTVAKTSKNVAKKE